jgi:hypothetical protein
MIAAAESNNPPRRLLLGSDAYARVTTALRERLRQIERNKVTTFSTDYDDFAPADPTPRGIGNQSEGAIL